jgi:hypothetical protein
LVNQLRLLNQTLPKPSLSGPLVQLKRPHPNLQPLHLAASVKLNNLLRNHLVRLPRQEPHHSPSEAQLLLNLNRQLQHSHSDNLQPPNLLLQLSVSLSKLLVASHLARLVMHQLQLRLLGRPSRLHHLAKVNLLQPLPSRLANPNRNNRNLQLVVLISAAEPPLEVSNPNLLSVLASQLQQLLPPVPVSVLVQVYLPHHQDLPLVLVPVLPLLLVLQAEAPLLPLAVHLLLQLRVVLCSMWAQVMRRWRENWPNQRLGCKGARRLLPDVDNLCRFWWYSFLILSTHRYSLLSFLLFFYFGLI